MIEFTHHLQCANWPRDATDQSRWPRRYFEHLFCVISRDAGIDRKDRMRRMLNEMMLKRVSSASSRPLAP